MKDYCYYGNSKINMEYFLKIVFFYKVKNKWWILGNFDNLNYRQKGDFISEQRVVVVFILYVGFQFG